MKDFQEDIIDAHLKESERLDPYIYVTPEMSQCAQDIAAISSLQFSVLYMASNVGLAPLQTIITSLQLSVKEHKNIFQSQEARTKELARLTTQMTIHEKRKFQLMIRAGGQTAPYTAPVYSSYQETIKGLKSQGWQAFFKGLACRSIYTFVWLGPYLKMRPMLLQPDMQKPWSQVSTLYWQGIALDVLTNPIQMMENRYILQNRLPQFRVLRRPIKIALTAGIVGENLKGIIFHFFNNTLGLFTRVPIYLGILSQNPLPSALYSVYFTGQFLIYPLLTAYRRLLCQTDRIVGMIPIRYSNLYHALKVIAYEEGPKGLWRGFPLHLLQSFIRLKILSAFSLSPQSQ